MTTFEYKTYMNHLEKETFIQRMADHFSVPNDSIRDILMWHEAQLHEYGKELQADILDLKNANERLTREVDLLDSKLDELKEDSQNYQNDYQDICELTEQIALPFKRDALIIAIGPENYERFKNHIGW
jgi:peptidoglycan hydrolase CwlO-like protein